MLVNLLSSSRTKAQLRCVRCGVEAKAFTSVILNSALDTSNFHQMYNSFPLSSYSSILSENPQYYAAGNSLLLIAINAPNKSPLVT